MDTWKCFQQYGIKNWRSSFIS